MEFRDWFRYVGKRKDEKYSIDNTAKGFHFLFQGIIPDSLRGIGNILAVILFIALIASLIFPSSALTINPSFGSYVYNNQMVTFTWTNAEGAAWCKYVDGGGGYNGDPYDSSAHDANKIGYIGTSPENYPQVTGVNSGGSTTFNELAYNMTSRGITNGTAMYQYIMCKKLVYGYPQYVTDQVYSNWTPHGWTAFTTTNYTPANVTFVVSESTDVNTKIANATITLSNGLTGITNAVGSVTIAIFPNVSTLTYGVTASMHDSLSSQVLGDYGKYGGTVYVSLNQQEGYYITVSPGWIPSDGTQYLYGEIHSSPVTLLQNITYVSWLWGKIGDAQSFKVYHETINPQYSTDYLKKQDGHFYGFDESAGSYSVDKGTSLPNPLTLNPVGATGTIQTNCYFTLDNGDMYAFNVTNLIGATPNSSQNIVKFITQDSTSSARIPAAGLYIKDAAYNNWTNTTTNNQGEFTMVIPVNHHLSNIEATANGYNKYIHPVIETIYENQTINLNMYSPTISNPDGGNVIVDVYYPADSTHPVAGPAIGANVVVLNQSNNSETYYGITNNYGKAFFSVVNDTTYSITASGGNYIPVTSIEHVNTNPYLVFLNLGSSGWTPVPTQTPIYITPTATPGPIITPSNWNGTGATCQAILPPNSTIKDVVMNGIACAGAEDAKGQSIVFAAIIIMIFVLIGSKYGKGLGAAVGGIIGFVICLGLDLIPIWMFFALLILSGLTFAGYAVSKGGK